MEGRASKGHYQSQMVVAGVEKTVLPGLAGAGSWASWLQEQERLQELLSFPCRLLNKTLL